MINLYDYLCIVDLKNPDEFEEHIKNVLSKRNISVPVTKNDEEALDDVLEEIMSFKFELSYEII